MKRPQKETKLARLERLHRIAKDRLDAEVARSEVVSMNSKALPVTGRSRRK